ncbi:hypothetical protein FE257_005419 [Aspergillus nanangensis]|uniref:Uncharacterized protein n=1 Tax=Aspergillus nanangensis TaxID=2582783 RepID=A0AAD4GWT8_ASPNN|nr:hypothetical protein FE257_005419 [Aspergillus nanangensis]
MHYITLLTALLAGVLLPINTLARDCLVNETTFNNYAPRMDLIEPSQLAQFDGCETLIGNIVISRHFTGKIELNTVTNFSGHISLDEKPTYGLEAVSLPNVQYMESISLRGAWGLNSLHAPKLEVLEDLVVTQVVEGGTLELPALRAVETLSLSGYWSSISFPSLETIDLGMWVYTDPTGEATDILVPVDIDFPVLKETAGMFIEGQIKSLSTPMLEVLGDPQGWPRGLGMRANYTAMEGVLLPSLRELHGLFSIDGSVSAVDLGGMQNTSAPIKIDVDSPTKIYSGLEHAGNISVHGPLAVINFTNLTTATYMDITSEAAPISCPRALVDIYRYFSDPEEPPFCSNESIAAAGENPYLDPGYTPSEPVTGYPTPTSDSSSDRGPTPTPSYTPSPTPTPVYTPTPTPGPGGGKLSTGAEAAIATGAALVGLVGIGGWIVARRRKRRVKNVATASGRAAAGAGDAVSRGASRAAGNRNTSSGRRGENKEALPRHSGDVAPPPYSRDPPGNV